MNKTSPIGTDPDRIIGKRLDGTSVTLGTIRYLVQQLQPLVTGQDCCLLFDDSLLFLAAFLAASHYGKSVVLPGNDKMAWIHQASIAHDVLLSDKDIEDCVPVGWPAPDVVSTFPDIDDLPVHDAPIHLYTSGSTGSPKAVLHYRRQFEQETAAIATAMPAIARNSLILATVPHGHMYGLTFRILFPWFQGHLVCSHGIQYWSDLDAWFSRNKHDWCLISSPAHLTRLQALPPAFPRPSMVMSSAGPLPAEDAGLCADTFASWPFEIFGSTETGAIAHRSQDAGNDWWQLAPGASLLPAGQDIQIVRAPWIDGDWPLEDRLEISTDTTRFRHLGRMDDIIKLEGKRVSLGDITRQVQALPSVKACRIFPHPEKRGLAAVIVLSLAGNRLLSEKGAFRLGRHLRQSLADRLETAALPRHWKFTTALPADDRGKTSRRMLEALMTETPETTIQPDQANAGFGEIRRLDAFNVEQTARLDAGMPEFDGHFPNAPIFPGIAMIDWVAQAGRELPGCQGMITGLGKVKFKQLLQPPATVTLKVTQKENKAGAIFASFTLTGEAGEIASGDIRFGARV